MQRGERVVLTALVCFLDPPLSHGFGIAHGTIAQWVLAVIAVTTFLTATYRTAWIASRLR
jgi:hypothetical protein